MATPARASAIQQSTYICSGVTVQGLPTRSVLKSEARYFVSISIDEEQVWKSREIRSKESTVVWDKEGDKHEFECAATGSLKVTLCKNHSRVAQLITKLTTNENSMLIRLSLSQKDTTPPAPETTLQEPIPTTGADANAAPPQPEGAANSPTAVGGDVGDFTHGLGDIATMLGELRGKLDLFATSIDEMPHIHPYLRMSWIILSATIIGSEVVEAQQQRIESIKRLIAKMTTVYEFLCGTRVLRGDKVRTGVLFRLALQTVDCAHFISS
ncbi:hypothetical protein CALVIDRAFT_603287 [Calocera viscosa TUFC12733]|uniref:Uncharacterized protein n=1 Tax=Calocera viscosa (strain TUFC12733) TaxID=1330018 RepID=A0A167FY59_CALVF|nr:hypothetical protein CALVIDRAFT_603287 [Calocera viscosa TUFC12733]